MFQQPEGRKYQLFPKGQTSSSKGLDPEQAFAHAISQSPKTEMGEKLSAATNGLRLRIKEHNLTRRRKISVPELGPPMTTVQETSMDSRKCRLGKPFFRQLSGLPLTVPATIPGRPALHERSISAPGTSWRQNQLDRHFRFSPDAEGQQLGNSAPEHTFSFRQLAPLVIPSRQSPAPKLSKQISLSRLRSGSTPTDGTQSRSARTDESPRSRTPLSSATTNMTPFAIPTPLSGPFTEPRASPHPWEGRAGSTTPTQHMLERAATPKTDEPRSAPVFYGHRRGYSESASSGMMDRGRPKKRPERTVPNFSFNPAASLQRAGSGSKKRSKSAERRNFEQLPTGWKASEVSNGLSPGEISELQKQAFGQAARFEVLRKEDVDALSRVRSQSCP
ncbi:hypothetical protein IMZ48_32995 [Candidatus Bathyarchaeota archaeon]|nr:hypothetical protein [Candidatus Bathyarchaeota archaeon]